VKVYCYRLHIQHNAFSIISIKYFIIMAYPDAFVLGSGRPYQTKLNQG